MTAATSIEQAFAAKVREARDASGLSQLHVARTLPYPLNRQITLSNIEQGKRKVSIGEAFVLAAALGFALSDFQPPVSCGSCFGTPPEGFTCNACGGAA